MDYDHVKKQLGYGIQTESKDNAIKAIEQLTARVRELETQLAANNPLLDEAANRIDALEEENARLRFAIADTEALELGTSERLATITRQRDELANALSLAIDCWECEAFLTDEVVNISRVALSVFEG